MFIRFITLIVPPVLAFLFWQDIVQAVPAGYSRDLLPLIAVVLYGALMLTFGMKPRPGSKVAALEAMVDNQRKVLNDLSKSVSAGFAGLKTDVAEMKDVQARTGKSLISVEQLTALQVFDPSINTKVPQLLALADALSKIEMPQFDLARVEGLVGLAQNMNKLAEMRQTLAGLDFAVLAEMTGKAGQLLDAVQGLSLDGEGDHRDYDDLKTLVGNVTETLQATAELVKPENGFSVTLASEVKVVGKIVDAVEEVVLDNDGDAIDFSDTTDAVKSLEELTTTVVPLVQRFKQTA